MRRFPFPMFVVVAADFGLSRPMRCSTERGRGSVERREIRCPKRSEWRHPHTGPSQVGLCLNQTADPAPMLSNRAREPAVEEAVK